MELLPLVGHLHHLLHLRLQPLFLNLLVKLLDYGLITSLTFLLFLNPLPLAPNRSLPSPSISPRATRWGSRGILSVSSPDPSSVVPPRTRTGPLQATNEIRAALDPKWTSRCLSARRRSLEPSS